MGVKVAVMVPVPAGSVVEQLTVPMATVILVQLDMGVEFSLNVTAPVGVAVEVTVADRAVAVPKVEVVGVTLSAVEVDAVATDQAKLPWEPA